MHALCCARLPVEALSASFCLSLCSPQHNNKIKWLKNFFFWISLGLVNNLVRAWFLWSLSVSARCNRRSGNQRGWWEEGRIRPSGTGRAARISRKWWVARATRYPRLPRKTGTFCTDHRIKHSWAKIQNSKIQQAPSYIHFLSCPSCHISKTKRKLLKYSWTSSKVSFLSHFWL